MRILQWMTFSARPLSVEEIAEVVAINVARDLAFDRDEVLEDPLEALSICSSLVTITKNEADGKLGPAQQIIALAHYSVQEYLVSDRIKQGSAKQYNMQEAECHDVITRGSLKYLIQLQRPLSEETFEEWDETEGSLLAISLMSTEKPAYLNWIRLYDPDDPWEDSDLERSLERTLLDKGINVNAQGRGYGNALQAASAQGHEQVVKALLDAGAEVNAQGGYYGNALHAAAYFGESAVLKLLVLKHDITQLQDPYDRTLLWWAAASGHSKTVQVLVNQYNYDPQINILYKDRQANISLNIKKFHQKLGQSIKRNRFQLSLSRAATRLKRYSQ
ncbi:fibronectin type 3 and ankyrin repeat domain protein 1 [Pyrenophora tritici-repentis]|nr:fibronectin type 3 and ankyrin repeat domain protein 1 [Pyrenophora tritici-repentis]